MEKTKDYMKNQLNLNIQGLKGIAAIVVFLSHALNIRFPGFKILWILLCTCFLMDNVLLLYF